MGAKWCCVGGNVVRPGVYEGPCGVSLGEMLQLAGGVPEGRTVQAVLLGGAAGGFVRGDELDIPLTFEGTRANNTTLWSGVVLVFVFDDTVDMMRILLRIAGFFREESCGPCVPSRGGTVRQGEARQRLGENGEPAVTGGERAKILDFGMQVMKGA